MFMSKFQSQTDKAKIYVVTPLMIACIEEHLGVVRVRLLSRKDIDINDENEDKYTALMYSCVGGNIEIVRCLLDHENIALVSREEEPWTARAFGSARKV